MNLWDDDRAQSIQIGAVLLFGIFIISFSSYQAFVIPNQNKDVEFSHFSETQTEIEDFRNGVISVGQDGKTVPVSVQLGTTYPSRMVAAQPQQSSGSLRIQTIGDDSNTFELQDLDDASITMADICGLSTVTTAAATYEPDYNYIETVGNITYENTLTYTNGEFEGRAFQTEQQIVEGKTIHLYPLVGESDRGGAGTMSLTLQGNKTGSKSVSDSDSFSLIVPTRLSASEWEQKINSDHVTGVNSHSGQAVKINFNSGDYDIKCSPVGAGEDPNNDPVYVGGGGGGGGGGDVQGPAVTSVATSTQSVGQGGPFDLTATIDDGGRGGSDIVDVEWWSNRSTPGGGAGSGYGMDATDGQFDQSVEDVENLSIDTSGWTAGWHKLSVRGKDGNLNWGPTNPTTIKIDPDPGPPGRMAYHDANNNLQYDSGTDVKISKATLENGYSNTNHNLVVPSDVGELSLTGDIKTKRMTFNSDITTSNSQIYLGAQRRIDISEQTLTSGNNKKIELKSGQGGSGSGDLIATDSNINSGEQLIVQGKYGIDITGASLNSADNKKIELKSGQGGSGSGDLIATDSNINSGEQLIVQGKYGIDITGASLNSADNKKIELKSGQGGAGYGDLTASDSGINSGGQLIVQGKYGIDITGASLKSADNNKLQVKAGGDGIGELDATDSTIDSGKKLTLQSNGDMYVDRATLSAGKNQNKKATANLQQGWATIHVESVAINAKHNELTYEPPGVTEDPERNDIVSG